MREFHLIRTNDVPIKFRGEVIAFATTNTSKSFNKKDRWTELTLYLTASGKYVSESVGVSTLANEMNIVKAEVFDDINKALEFFRNKHGQFTWASNQILQQTQEKFPDVASSFGISI